jgi:hypothetical protein
MLAEWPTSAENQRKNGIQKKELRTGHGCARLNLTLSFLRECNNQVKNVNTPDTPIQTAAAGRLRQISIN